ncbi:AraC family transcriptional regulator [Polymorphospora sp. NPDC051019]|uniref:helix-turn-helix domain-containing protein n=1 Tax=Polymorphospora sp. NPDC051019 TaxID=3155725 RepID=UPI0034369F48
MRARDFDLDRAPASADLAGLVERHWLVRWDLPEDREGSVSLLPHPCVNLFATGGPVAVAGVGDTVFTYRYRGRGHVFGVKFRPGGFAPFLAGPVARLTGQTRPLAELWGAADAARLAHELAAAGPDLDTLTAIAERHLRARRPAPDPEVERVGRIVRTLLHDRSVVRVDEVATRFGLSSRSLQRLFQRHVGVSPKWILRRYRLHEAAARLAEDGPANWSEVAADLGYFDQSHFIRDFSAAVGMTPAAYADACRRHVQPVSA